MDREHLKRRHQTKNVDDPRAPAAPGKTTLLERVMRKADGNGIHDGADEAVARAAQSSGARLPEHLQRKFESSLGSDLSNVRVHTGGESVVAARSISARAYTTGRDIHFDSGQYNPDSHDGQQLLAHEVAHTVQQSNVTATPQRTLEVSAPHDAAEVEADGAADRMLAAQPVQVGAAGGVARVIQRDYTPGPSERYNPHVDDWLPERNWLAEAAPVDADASAMASTWQFLPVWCSRDQLTTNVDASMRSSDTSLPRTDERQKTIKLAGQSFTVVALQTVAAWNGAVPAIQEYTTTSTAAEPALRSLSGLDGVGNGDVADLAGRKPASGTSIATGDAIDSVKTSLGGGPVIDKEQLPQTQRDEIVGLQDTLTQQTAGVGACKAVLSNYPNDIMIQLNNADSAMAGIQISHEDYNVTVYEQQERTLKAAKDAAKGAINGMTSVAKGFFSLGTGDAKGVGDVFSGFGKLVETGVDLHFDTQINDVHDKIVNAKAAIDQLKTRQGLDTIASCFETAANTVNKAREYYANVYLKAVNERKQTIAKLSQKMQEAASKSGASDETAKSVGAAVKALPIVEEVVRAIQRVMPLLPDLPPYTPTAGRGAGMCANLDELIQHVSTMRGVKAHFAKNQTLWEGRLRVIQSLLQQAR